MDDIYTKYDTNAIGDHKDSSGKKVFGRLKSIRKARYKQYLDSHSLDDVIEKKGEAYKRYLEYQNKYEKFKICGTQEKVADELTIRRPTYSSWESGAKTPSLDSLIELCKFYNCSLDYMLGITTQDGFDTAKLGNMFTGIDANIIQYGLEHPEYLACLNFFMLPDNSRELFNSVTLDNWKRNFVITELTEIEEPLRKMIIDAREEFSSITLIQEQNKNNFKKYLSKKITPQTISSEDVKKSLPKIYDTLLTNGNLNYTALIRYITDNAYADLYTLALIESNKAKIANKFMELLSNYYRQPD